MITLIIAVVCLILYGCFEAGEAQNKASQPPPGWIKSRGWWIKKNNN